MVRAEPLREISSGAGGAGRGRQESRQMDQPVCHAPQDGRSLDFVRIHLYPGKGEVAALMPAWLGYFKKQAAFMKRP